MEPVGRSDRSSAFERRRRTSKSDRKKPISFSKLFEDSPAVEGLGGTAAFERDDTPLEEVLDAVHELGEKVKKEPRRTSVLAYKRAVKRLVSIAIERGLAVEEQTSSPNILKQKRFTLIKIIDEKLDRLVSGVLINQRETLDVLGRIDEINGLLVDLIS